MTQPQYFGRTATGVNSDIKRHRAEERKLRTKIAELESRDRDSMEEHVLAVYRGFLLRLQESKAEATAKIGRKPKGKA